MGKTFSETHLFSCREIELPKTSKRSAHKAKLEVRFCQVNLRTPYRFDNRDPLQVYAVYAIEVDCPAM